MKRIRKLVSISQIVLVATILFAANVIIFVHYNEYKNITKSIADTENTENLDKKTTTMKLGLQQMVINQRAYILLGNSKYKEKFYSYYNVLDDYLIDISKNLTDDESDKIIKSVNSNISELKILLKEKIEDKDKGNVSKFVGRADNLKMLSLYDKITEELEQISLLVWSKHQEDIKNTREAYSNYSTSILLSSLGSVVILAILSTMLVFAQKKTIKTQGELSDVNQRLNILLQATSDGILDWDLKENKLLISPKFKKLLGYEENEIKSDFDAIFDLIHPDDKLLTWLYAKKIITPEQPVYNQIFRMKHKDDSWSWISAKGIGFFDKTSQMERFVGVHTDVTLQKNLESILQYSKDKAEIEGQQKSDFLAYMSHEIRSPISAVIGLTKILSQTSPLTDEQKKYLEALKTGADTVYGLLNNILDLSKLDAYAIKLEKIEFNLQQIVEYAISLSSFPAREKHLKLTSHIPSEANSNFIGDPHRIKQIISNLLSNAIKFTESGSVDISIKLFPESHNERVRTEIIVTDTGIGIDDGKLAAIFDPYTQSADETTRKYGGTGLGLSICKQFTELMGGKIEVISKKEKGSVFKVILNLEKSVKPHTSLFVKSKKSKPVGKPNILLVEDYAPNIVVAETVIEDLGYSCVSVSTAKEAILKLSSREGKNINTVLMDIQLPDMNGFEATKLIRKLEADNAQPPRRIIAMTAYDLLGDREKCIKAGMDDYISKPFDTEELSEKLKQPKIKATA